MIMNERLNLKFVKSKRDDWSIIRFNLILTQNYEWSIDEHEIKKGTWYSRNVFVFRTR